MEQEQLIINDSARKNENPKKIIVLDINEDRLKIAKSMGLILLLI